MLNKLLDGFGYPEKLISKNISKENQVYTIVDIFDAIVTDLRIVKPW